MSTGAVSSSWQSIAILIGRLIFAGIFAMAAFFKFFDMNATAGYIASAGFPVPLPLAWIAAFVESALVICFLTGAFFTEASLLAAIYVLFLAFAFHGPIGQEIRPSSVSSPDCCSLLSMVQDEYSLCLTL